MIYHITATVGGETSLHEAEGNQAFQDLMRELFNERWRVATVFKFNGEKGWEKKTFIKAKDSTNWKPL
jgi:hypothetical protein